MRKNDIICAFWEFIMDFIGEWKPPPSHWVASYRKGAPMRQNRELENLFSNLSATKFFSWLLHISYAAQNAAKTKKNSSSPPFIEVLITHHRAGYIQQY